MEALVYTFLLVSTLGIIFFARSAVKDTLSTLSARVLRPLALWEQSSAKYSPLPDLSIVSSNAFTVHRARTQPPLPLLWFKHSK